MKIKSFTPHHSQWNGKPCPLKSILLLVAMLLIATSNSFAQASFETIDGIRYLIDSDAKTATVMPMSGDQKYSGDVAVPEKVKATDGNEYPVTAFGDNAFNRCSGLTSITIPSSVTSLGNDCFYSCSSLTSIAIPSSVKTIGEACFSSCYGLTSIAIPSSVTTIGSNCFSYCSGLTSITIPSSVTSLDILCFFVCTGLTSITIPSSVTSLGFGCFHGCSALKNITIPSAVKNIDNGCFGGCSSMESVTFKGECPKGTIDSSIPTTCILYVPKAYLQDYKNALGSKYPYIYASKDEDGQGEDKPVTACATPTITYSDGELQFASTTDGAQYHYTITDADIKTDAYSENGKVQLAAAYNITAYATADGYKQSDKATAVLYWVKANGNLENISTNINQAKTRGIVATSHDGIVTLSGLDNDEEVRFYAADGKQIGAAKAIDGVVSQAVSTASLVIAKIGSQAIKIAVK